MNTTDRLVIRPARPGDAQAILDLWARARSPAALTPDSRYERDTQISRFVRNLP